MITFQHKKGEVCSYSKGQLKCDKLKQIDLDITKDTLKKIESHNYNLFIRKNKLILIEGAVLVREKEKEKEDKEFETLSSKIKDKNIVKLLTKLRR